MRRAKSQRRGRGKVKAAAEKLWQADSKLNAFERETGRRRRREREYGPAAGNQSRAQIHMGNALTDGAGNGTMMVDGRGNWQAITPESMQAVPRFSEFETAGANEAVHKACVDVLKDMEHRPLGTEEAISVRLSDLSTEKTEGEPGEGTVVPIDLNEPYLAVHNHPSNETFSFADIDAFGMRANCVGIVAIGNNGANAFTLLKSGDYDLLGFALFRAKVDKGYISFKSEDDFLKGLEAYGIHYQARRP